MAYKSNKLWEIKDSPIHGVGVFIKRFLIKGERIHGPGRCWSFRGYNHSCQPNMKIVSAKRSIRLKALRDIKPGEELTVNYGCDINNCNCDTCI